MNEASFAETPSGRYVTSDGWFVLNLGDALAVRNEEKGGASLEIETPEHPFPNVGVHVSILWPGDPNGLYHSEGAQEGFLVLAGECTLIVEEQERRLRQWDYFHCPAGTNHIFLGAGDGPCAILMVGARPDGPSAIQYSVAGIRYPVSDVAARHGASVSRETDDPDQAYSEWPGEFQPVRLLWPPADDDTNYLR
jgi:uncharacterized cupin superfamily protein